ncbi:hypothetical protein SBA4_3890004 [Candidatus Sulfopaludibacter sp. SbA4]|nr:hypothetical protein SBA4_3890004 [Candidatus Sulfopaludibacter sp. SbA4]
MIGNMVGNDLEMKIILGSAIVAVLFVWSAAGMLRQRLRRKHLPVLLVLTLLGAFVPVFFLFSLLAIRAVDEYRSSQVIVFTSEVPTYGTLRSAAASAASAIGRVSHKDSPHPYIRGRLLLLDGPMSVEYQPKADVYQKVDSTPDSPGTPQWIHQRESPRGLSVHYLYFDLPEELRAKHPDEVGTLATVDCRAESSNQRTVTYVNGRRVGDSFGSIRMC